MPDSHPARTAARRKRSTVLAAIVVGAALIGVLGYRSFANPTSSATSPIAVRPLAQRAHDSVRGDDRGVPGELPREHRGAAGEADGVLPDGVTVFDGGYPGIANLDPALLAALRRAATDAADDGVVFSVDSAWRSPTYQEQLLREAISEYGSREEAARWVATPKTSAHVSGDAVDIGHPGDDDEAWLSGHGAAYGLCQVYLNEPWHYELRPGAVDDGCPPMYADPTHDPRMQQ